MTAKKHQQISLLSQLLQGRAEAWIYLQQNLLQRKKKIYSNDGRFSNMLSEVSTVLKFQWVTARGDL